LLVIIKAYFMDKRHCDCSNLPKGILDALEGIAYKNDRQIKTLHVEVYEGNLLSSFEVEILTSDR